MSDVDNTGYDPRDEQNRRRAREVNGAVQHIRATLHRAKTPTMGGGERGEAAIADIMAEHFNKSGDVRGELEIRKSPAYRCDVCLMPASAHAVFGGELVHDPVLRHEDYRDSGVTPGVENYDENYADSPNHRARRERGEFMFGAADPEELAEAEDRWRRATHRHRPVD